MKSNPGGGHGSQGTGGDRAGKHKEQPANSRHKRRASQEIDSMDKKRQMQESKSALPTPSSSASNEQPSALDSPPSDTVPASLSSATPRAKDSSLPEPVSSTLSASDLLSGSQVLEKAIRLHEVASTRPLARIANLVVSSSSTAQTLLTKQQLGVFAGRSLDSFENETVRQMAIPTPEPSSSLSLDQDPLHKFLHDLFLQMSATDRTSKLAVLRQLFTRVIKHQAKSVAVSSSGPSTTHASNTAIRRKVKSRTSAEHLQVGLEDRINGDGDTSSPSQTRLPSPTPIHPPALGYFHVHFIRALYDETWGGYDANSFRRRNPRSPVWVSRAAICDFFETGKDGSTLPEYWAKRSDGKHPRMRTPDTTIARALRQLTDFTDITSKMWLHAVQMIGYMLDHPTPTSAVFALDVAVAARIRDNAGYFDAVLAASQQAGRIRCTFADCALVLAQKDPTLASVATRAAVDAVCGLSVANGQVVFARDGVSSWSEIVGGLLAYVSAEQAVVAAVDGSVAAVGVDE